MNMKSVLAAAAVTVGMASAASAATTVYLTYDFTGAASTASSMSIDPTTGWTAMQVDVTANHYSVDGSGNYLPGTPIDVSRNGAGLGSRNPGVEQGDSVYVDSMGADESLIFTFDREVSLTDVVISYFIGSGSYQLFADSIAAVLPTGLATSFAIGTGSDCGQDLCVESGVKISSISIAAEVPLPASGLLLMGALAGAGAISRRKKS